MNPETRTVLSQLADWIADRQLGPADLLFATRDGTEPPRSSGVLRREVELARRYRVSFQASSTFGSSSNADPAGHHRVLHHLAVLNTFLSTRPASCSISDRISAPSPSDIIDFRRSPESLTETLPGLLSQPSNRSARMLRRFVDGSPVSGGPAVIFGRLVGRDWSCMEA